MTNLKTLYFLLIFFGVLLLQLACGKKMETPVDAADLPMPDSLFAHAAILGKANKPDSAKLLFTQAANAYRAARNWEKWEKSVLEVRGIYRKQDKHAAAAKYLEYELQLVAQLLPDTSAHIGKIDAFIGISYSKTGNFNLALTAYNNALRIFEANHLQNALAAQIYKNAGNIYTRQLDYYKALDYLQKSLQLNQQLKEYAAAANVHSDLAIVYRYLEDYEQELVHYQQAEAMPGIDTVQQAIFTANQADTYLQQQQFTKALQYCRQALKLFNTVPKPQPDYLASVYNLMGEVYATQNQYANALQSYGQAKQFAIAAYGEHHRELARIYVSIGNLFLQQQQNQAAIQQYQFALQALIPEFTPLNANDNPVTQNFYPEPFIFTALTQKAKAFSQQFTANSATSVLDTALQTYELALQQASLMQLGYSAQESKLYVSAYQLTSLEEAIQTALKLYQITANSSYITKTLTLMEYGKAGALLQAVRETEALKYAGLPDSTLQQKRDLELNIYRLSVAQTNPQQQDSLFACKRNLEKLNAENEKQFSQYQSLHSEIELPDINALRQNLLTDTTALVAYFMSKTQVVAIACTQNRQALYRIATDTLFTQQIGQLLQLLSQPAGNADAKNNYQSYANCANSLYQQLLQPLLTQFPDPIKRLIIVPDGILSYLPFEALLTALPDVTTPDYRPAHTPYLLNTCAVSYAPSVNMLLQSMKPPAYRASLKNWLGFAPAFSGQPFKEAKYDVRSDCSSGELQPLVCNIKELESIVAITGGKLKQGKGASKQAFLTNAANYHIIHLATHACVNNEQPLLSKIYFTDNYLQTYELYTLPPTNARLIVLSACNTGTGTLALGEGVLSLSRGFMYAACPSVLTTLWSVNDCATADIMTQFYAQLITQHLPKPEALQQAKLNYLANPALPASGAHPFYWASAVQVGNYDTIPLNPSQHFGVIIALCALILLAGIVFYRKRKPIVKG